MVAAYLALTMEMPVGQVYGFEQGRREAPVTTTIQIDQELRDRIRRLAELGQIPADQVVREAIAQYAERVDLRQDFLREADQSWDPIGETACSSQGTRSPLG